MEPVVRDRLPLSVGRSVAHSSLPSSTWRLLLPQLPNDNDCPTPPATAAAPTMIWFRNWNTPTNLWHNCCPHKIRPLGVSLPIPSLHPFIHPVGHAAALYAFSLSPCKHILPTLNLCVLLQLVACAVHRPKTPPITLMFVNKRVSATPCLLLVSSAAVVSFAVQLLSRRQQEQQQQQQHPPTCMRINFHR